MLQKVNYIGKQCLRKQKSNIKITNMWNKKRHITADATNIIKAIGNIMKTVYHQISQLTGNAKFIEIFYQN